MRVRRRRPNRPRTYFHASLPIPAPQRRIEVSQPLLRNQHLQRNHQPNTPIRSTPAQHSKINHTQYRTTLNRFIHSAHHLA